tara:strand:- start:3827 stop:4660 length:834 start_codon:yes stop_codon:yes gene_type:complete
MLTYKEYYEICKKSYKNDLKVDKNLYEFTYEMPDIAQFGEEYSHLVADISSFLKEKYLDEANIYNIPHQDPKEQPLSRYKKPWEIPNIEKLANILIPYVEKTIFNCNLYAMAAYVYKTRSGMYDSKSVGSLLWHIDNHPEEVIKIMVYLEDVDETSGPFQILDKQGSGSKVQTTRVDHKDWTDFNPQTRYSDSQIDHFRGLGYIPKNLTGPAGTVIIFDNNIIHRATLCDKKERSVITFMVKPIDRKIRPYISEQHTGTNYYEDVFKDPAHFGAIEK